LYLDWSTATGAGSSLGGAALVTVMMILFLRAVQAGR
jgi:hypothetical protein